MNFYSKLLNINCAFFNFVIFSYNIIQSHPVYLVWLLSISFQANTIFARVQLSLKLFAPLYSIVVSFLKLVHQRMTCGYATCIDVEECQWLLLPV